MDRNPQLQTMLFREFRSEAEKVLKDRSEFENAYPFCYLCGGRHQPEVNDKTRTKKPHHTQSILHVESGLPLVCPECKSKHLARDYDHAEVICADCELVRDNRDPEWQVMDQLQKLKMQSTYIGMHRIPISYYCIVFPTILPNTTR